MFKVNLVRNAKRVRLYKKWVSGTRLFIFILVPVLILVYVIFFVNIFLLQQETNAIKARLPGLVSAKIDRPLTGNVDYSRLAKKLAEIKRVYSDSPEYFAQYEYLLGLILRYDDLVVENFALNSGNSAELALSAKKIDTIFSFLALLEKEKNLQNFSELSLESVSFVKDKREDNSGFRVILKLKFVPLFTK